jgi:arsenite-transporting ATPase
MSGMMGLNPQEDMFGKLEGMRAVITEVNNQFKDPVSTIYYCFYIYT